MDYWIFPVYQVHSARLNYEGNLQNLQIIKTTNTTNDECKMLAIFFGILLGTLVTISGCALLALEIIQLAISAVLFFPGSKLIVVFFWNRITFVRSIRTWFRKRAKQPGNSNCRMSEPRRSRLTDRKRGRTRASTIKRSKLTTIKQGRLTVAIVLVALLFHFTGNLFLLLFGLAYSNSARVAS